MAFEEGASIGNGHNAAWYAYDASIGAFVRVYSWYEPEYDTTPIQPDEIDVTSDPELGIAGNAALSASTPRRGEETISCDRGFPLPSRTVTGTTYGGGGGGIIGFLWRLFTPSAGGARAGIRLQARDQVVQLPNRDCHTLTSNLDACTVARGHVASLPGFGRSVMIPEGMHFTFVFRDGRRSEWVGTGMSECVQISRSCYSP